MEPSEPPLDPLLLEYGVSAENRGGVIGRRVENVGILSPEAVASGERERERSQHQECLDAVFVDEVHCIEKWRVSTLLASYLSLRLRFRPHL